jgi:RNA polymerase sigma-70 factor (ECF subfamily)
VRLAFATIIPALSSAEATSDLLAKARAGDARARDALLARFLPRLRKWARGRLPGWCRELCDPGDLVQLERAA